MDYTDPKSFVNESSYRYYKIYQKKRKNVALHAFSSLHTAAQPKEKPTLLQFSSNTFDYIAAKWEQPPKQLLHLSTTKYDFHLQRHDAQKRSYL